MAKSSWHWPIPTTHTSFAASRGTDQQILLWSQPWRAREAVDIESDTGEEVWTGILTRTASFASHSGRKLPQSHQILCEISIFVFLAWVLPDHARFQEYRLLSIPPEPGLDPCQRRDTHNGRKAHDDNENTVDGILLYSSAIYMLHVQSCCPRESTVPVLLFLNIVVLLMHKAVIWQPVMKWISCHGKKIDWHRTMILNDSSGFRGNLEWTAGPGNYSQ